MNQDVSSPATQAEGPTPQVSVVVPFYQEEAAAADLVAELREVLGGLSGPTQQILVDDGSRDHTFARLCEATREDPSCVVLRLARNCGQTAALAAGIDRAEGKVIVLLDGDGQNDPRDIPALLAKLEEGYGVVSGWRRQRQDKLFTRRIPSLVANRLVARLSGVHLNDFGCSLKAYRSEFLKPIPLYGEMHRFLVIQAVWAGARPAELEVNHRPRTTGVSKYGLERIFKVLLDLSVMLFLRKYLTKPAYLFGGFGLLSFLGAFLAGIAALGFRFAPKSSGWQKDLVETPLPQAVVLLSLVGVLCLMMGLLAEMLTRTYHESQHKPVYSLGEEVRGRETPSSETSAQS